MTHFVSFLLELFCFKEFPIYYPSFYLWATFKFEIKRLNFNLLDSPMYGFSAFIISILSLKWFWDSIFCKKNAHTLCIIIRCAYSHIHGARSELINRILKINKLKINKFKRFDNRILIYRSNVPLKFDQNCQRCMGMFDKKFQHLFWLLFSESKSNLEILVG